MEAQCLTGETTMSEQQIAIPCVYMRGGTSKAVYLMGSDLPPPGEKRNKVLMRIMGSPDLTEIDGMGGAQIVTSKLAVIDPPSRSDADIDYTFGQAEIDHPHIDYDANCGNISSAVGPFAIDSGLIRAQEPITRVRIHNTNTGKIFIADVPVVNGEVAVQGDYSIAGVPGAGARIDLDYSGTAGAVTGKCLPTGNATDTVTLESGKTIEVTVFDAGNLGVFAKASDLGVTCHETKQELDENQTVLDRVREIRGKAAQMIGMCERWQELDTVSPLLPLVILAKEPESKDEDLRVRMFLLNKCHPALAGTGSVCTSSSGAVFGTIVNQLATIASTEEYTLRIMHPQGIMPLHVASRSVSGQLWPEFLKIQYGRTARKIMSGQVYIPNVEY